jgi:hypothetical protein
MTPLALMACALAAILAAAIAFAAWRDTKLRTPAAPPKRPARRSSRLVLVAETAGWLNCSCEEVMRLVAAGKLRLENGRIVFDDLATLLVDRQMADLDVAAHYAARDEERRFSQ